MAGIALVAPLAGRVRALDTVPDAVFAERMLGDGIAIDPVGDCLHAPCDAVVAAVQPTGHAITLRLDCGAELIVHIGLDTVALGGRGFTAMVRAGDAVRAGDPLIRFDLELLVREVRAVVTPIVVAGEGFAVTDMSDAGIVAVGDPLMRIVPVGNTAAPAAEGDTAERRLLIALPHGIHARPAARIAALARAATVDLRVGRGERSADARSPTALLALAIRHGDAVTVRATGHGADDAVAALAALIEDGLNEPAHAPAGPPRPAAAVPAGTLAGITAAGGIAVGRIHRHRRADIVVPVEGCGVAEERRSFDAAHHALVTRIADHARHAAGTASAIAEAHAALLHDPALVARTHDGIARGESAGHAWRAALAPEVTALRATGDARIAERADDLLDLERQLLAVLTGAPAAAAPPPAGAILIADELMPSDVMALEGAGIAAICLGGGGPTSHVAILAAAMGLPALVAIGPALAGAAEGAQAIVDADAGHLRLAPDAAAIAEAEWAIAAAEVRRADALSRAAEACRTADGVRIEVAANLATREEAAQAVAAGAEGCGLLRTELLFLDRPAPPGREEQAIEYQAIADTLGDRPLIVRLLDIGGDKPAPYVAFAPEENPALGLRGIRVGLADPALLDTQLDAILAVRPQGRCRIMVPMVAGLDELRAVRARLDALGGGDARIELGVMVETPAAAVTADLLAREADFLSIGTNDLTQYALAMDRGNPAVAAAVDGLHPAVLRLVAQACVGAERHGRWTGVCGSLASDPLAVPILLGLGVTELSTTIAAVAGIKAVVRGLTIPACRDHAAAALACDGADAVRALARRFATTAGETGR